MEDRERRGHQVRWLTSQRVPLERLYNQNSGTTVSATKVLVVKDHPSTNEHSFYSPNQESKGRSSLDSSTSDPYLLATSIYVHIWPVPPFEMAS